MRESRVLTTNRGSRPEAFGPVEWSLLTAIGVTWGSSFIFMAESLETFRPGVVTLLRLALGTATVALFPRARRAIDAADWPRIAVLGVVWMAIPLLLFPLAQVTISSSLAGMINGGMPLFAAVFASLMLWRAPGPRQVVGLLVGFAGVIALTWSGGVRGGIGVVWALVATALYGLAANLTVPLQQRYGSLPVILRAQAVAMIVVLPFGVLAIGGSAFAWDSLLATVPPGVLGTGLAFVAMATLVGRAGATRGAVAIYFIPVVATVLGVTVRDETVGPEGLAGLILVIGGAYLTSRREVPTTPSSERGAERAPTAV
ncbi:MAG: DMT family transporter [Actinomycetota bacterium]|nr:DMT family transporter [Actinomycetota bacterium]